MYIFEVKKATPITILLFVFLLIADSFTLSSNSAKAYKALLESGERLLSEGEYKKAVPLIKDAKTLAILHHLLSLVYFKMGELMMFNILTKNLNFYISK